MPDKDLNVALDATGGFTTAQAARIREVLNVPIDTGTGGFSELNTNFDALSGNFYGSSLTSVGTAIFNHGWRRSGGTYATTANASYAHHAEDLNVDASGGISAGSIQDVLEGLDTRISANTSADVFVKGSSLGTGHQVDYSSSLSQGGKLVLTRGANATELASDYSTDVLDAKGRTRTFGIARFDDSMQLYAPTESSSLNAEFQLYVEAGGTYPGYPDVFFLNGVFHSKKNFQIGNTFSNPLFVIDSSNGHALLQSSGGTQYILLSAVNGGTIFAEVGNFNSQINTPIIANAGSSITISDDLDLGANDITATNAVFTGNISNSGGNISLNDNTDVTGDFTVSNDLIVTDPETNSLSGRQRTITIGGGQLVLETDEKEGVTDSRDAEFQIYCDDQGAIGNVYPELFIMNGNFHSKKKFQIGSGFSTPLFKIQPVDSSGISDSDPYGTDYIDSADYVEVDVTGDVDITGDLTVGGTINGGRATRTTSGISTSGTSSGSGTYVAVDPEEYKFLQFDFHWAANSAVAPTFVYLWARPETGSGTMIIAYAFEPDGRYGGSGGAAWTTTGTSSPAPNINRVVTIPTIPGYNGYLLAKSSNITIGGSSFAGHASGEIYKFG